MSSSEVCFIWKIDQDNYTTVIILPVQLPLRSFPTDAFYSLASLFCFALNAMQDKTENCAAHKCLCEELYLLEYNYPGRVKLLNFPLQVD